MVAGSANETIQQLRIEKEIYIAAPIDIAFEATLEELGPDNSLPDGTSMPLVLEAWPGGRWFRDLGDNSGHFWGHVQVIKPSKLLEICGPLFMSYPCANHIQYRFVSEGIGTKLTFLHRGFAEIPDDHRQQIGIGWNHIIEQIKRNAESRQQS
jgi:hypothetical protein